MKLNESIMKNLKESSESFFGHTVEDDLEEYGGPVGFDRFCQRAIDFGVEDEAFETYGSRSQSDVNKVVKNYYKEYKEAFKKNLKEEKAYPRVSPEFEVYDKTYGSITNDDAVDTLDELIRYFSDFSATVKEDGFKYQGADAAELDKVVSLLTEARTTLDKMWENV